MKIGILTQPLRNNYGGLLQNYALQTVLNKNGHNPITIDWCASYTLKEVLWRKRQYFMYIVGMKGVSRPIYYPNKKEDKVISKNTERFINRYISRTPVVTEVGGFRRAAESIGCEAFVVGSDQVWRPGNNGFPLAMFLDFTEGMNVKRIAYAASFGTSKWEYTPVMTQVCFRLAKKFDLISVREKTGADLCKEHLGVDAVHVLDPTMLLDREDYEKLVFAEEEPKSIGSLFYYILDPNDTKKALIDEISNKLGLNPFTTMPICQAENRTRWDVKHRINDCVFPSVTSWLRSFMDAEMVIVDSFHGAVFSIIFNKPFWVIENPHRGNARFESLLSQFGLEDRMILPDKILDNDWEKAIDWERVNDIRKQEKERCVCLLKEALVNNYE